MPNVRDYIAQRLAENEDKLKEAQDQQTRGRGMSGLAEGLGQAVAGASGAPDSYNSNSYKFLNDAAEAPVKDELERQKSKMQGMQELGAEQDMQFKNEQYDPNSTRSQMVQKIIGKYNKGLDGTPFAAVDAPMIQHLETTREAAETRKEIAKANKDRQWDRDADKADSELAAKRSQLGSRGGNAKYVDAIRRSENIQKLLDQYPDLNKMPQNQVNLLYSEMDSLVNGGVPTHAGISAISPGSKMAQLQKWASTWDNKPHGAELGAFIEDSRPYISDVTSNAREHMKRENTNLINGYKGRLRPDAYTRHMNEVEGNYAAPARPKRLNGPHGKSVTQNGHVYTWNPDTEQYE